MFFGAAAILLCGCGAPEPNTVKSLLREAEKAQGVIVVNNKVKAFDLRTMLPASSDVGLSFGPGRLTRIFFDKSPDSVQEQMKRAIFELDDPDYETLAVVAYEGVRAWYLVKKESRGTINEVVTLSIDNYPDIWRIRGRDGKVNHESLLESLQNR